MPQWKKNLYVLWVGTFVAGMSFSLVGPFMPMLLKSVGTKDNLEMWSGLAFSASFITSAIMGPVWGAIGDKYGRKLMIIRAGIGIGLTYIGMSFAYRPWHIIAFRVLTGLSSGFIPSAIALASTNTPEKHIGSTLGILQTGGAAGSIMGPLIGGVMSHYLGIQKTLLLAGCILFGATLIVALGVREQHEIKKGMKTNVLRDLRVASTNSTLMVMFLTIMMFQTAYQVLQPILPIYIEKIAGSTEAAMSTGFIFSLGGIATVIAAPIWGRKGEKIGFKPVLLIGLVGAAALSLVHAVAASIAMLAALRFAFGLFMAALMPACNTLIARSVSSDFRGRAFGISTSFNQLGGAIGPMLGGTLGGYLGLRSVFIATSALLILTATVIKSKDIEKTPYDNTASIAV